MVDGRLVFDTLLNTTGLTRGLSMVGSLASGAFSAISKGLLAAGTAMGVATAAIVKSAVQCYAEYEQLVGGVETLFGAGGQTLKEYAKSVNKTTSEVKSEYKSLKKAQEEVLNNASRAYETAGMSANAYMETVTSFSAALIKSLDGDTAAAAKKADQAIIDMSDNANKMGSDMESIQNAYQGFAKQNYTMLDNLKLGYGGTKTEMERLLADAEKIKAAQGEVASYSIDSYADVVDAIHVVQEEMGIAGTTAKEASTTISGSLNAAKAAWSNLLTGVADDTQDFETLVNNVVDTFTTAGHNLLPRIEIALGGVGRLIEELLPEILGRVPEIIMDMLPGMLAAFGDITSELVLALAEYAGKFMTVAMSVINSFIAGINENLPVILIGAANIIMSLINGIVTMLPQLVPVALQIMLQIVNSLLSMLPQIIQAGCEVIIQLALGIAEALPELIPTIVDVVLQIVEVLIDNAEMLVDASMTLILALADGLIDALPILLEKAPVIISKTVAALIRNFDKIQQAGIQLIIKLIAGIVDSIPKLMVTISDMATGIIEELLKYIGDMTGCGDQLVNGLWQGIKRTWSDLVGKVSSLCQQLIDKVKQMFDIHSPSKKFAWIGKMCIEGFDQEFTSYNPYDSLSQSMKANKGTLTMAYNAGIEAAYGAAGEADYSKYAEANVKAFRKSGLTVVLDGRTIGRLR